MVILVTTIRKRIASLLAAALCLSLLAVPAGAYVRVDEDAPVSLTLNFYDKERDFAFEGMKVDIYKVLDMSDAVEFTYTEDGPFASHFNGTEGVAQVTIPKVDLDQSKYETEEAFRAAWSAAWQEGWKSLASTLVNYLSGETITPTATGTVAVVNADTDDKTGQVKFENLTVGVYLVVPEGDSDGSYTYTTPYYLAALPGLSSADEWVYDLVVPNKWDRSYHGGGGGTPGGSTINRNVMKVWENADGVDQPDSVTVQLLRDGEVYDEVELNDGNEWQKSWTGLSSDYDWTLVEADVPSDYTVSIEEDGNTFVVTNTADTELIEEEPPLGPGPSDPGTDIPDDSTPMGPGEDNGGEEIIDEDVPMGNLPQTGTLWLPVQILALAGILLFSIGWLDLKRQKRHET